MCVCSALLLHHRWVVYTGYLRKSLHSCVLFLSTCLNMSVFNLLKVILLCFCFLFLPSAMFTERAGLLLCAQTSSRKHSRCTAHHLNSHTHTRIYVHTFTHNQHFLCYFTMVKAVILVIIHVITLLYRFDKQLININLVLPVFFAKIVKIIHSFVFSSYCVVARVAVDPEPNPGTLGMSQEYTLDRGTIRMHTHRQAHSWLGQFSIANWPFSMSKETKEHRGTQPET